MTDKDSTYESTTDSSEIFETWYNDQIQEDNEKLQRGEKINYDD